MNLGPTELVIILVGLIPFGLSVFALVDVARRSDTQFAAAGQSRTTWLIVAIAAFFVPCVFLGSIYYLVAVRPKMGPA